MALQADYSILRSSKRRCRICLEASNDKIELNQYTSIHLKRNYILLTELLEFCVNEQVSENGKADELCLVCLKKAMVCYEFKRQFKLSQAVLLKEMEENNGFSFEIKVEEDFEEGSFEVESENIEMKHEILEEEGIEQVKENPNECELPTTATEKLTPTTTLSGEPTTALPHQPTISMGGMEENDGFSFEIKVEEDFEEGSFEVESEDIVIKDEILKEEELEQVKENQNKCELPTTTTETSTPTTIRSDKLTLILCGDKPTLTPPDDQPTISLGQKEVVHTKQKDHVCQQCGATFTTVESLSRHEVLHSMGLYVKYVKMKCTICKKAFRTDLGMKEHMATHRRKYACEFCGQRFRRSSNLNDHLKIHKGEIPYICEVCGKSFIQFQTLRRHVNNH